MKERIENRRIENRSLFFVVEKRNKLKGKPKTKLKGKVAEKCGLSRIGRAFFF